MAGFRFNPEDYAGLPTTQAPSPDKGLVLPALQSGVSEAAGELSRVGQAFGDLVGSKTISDASKYAADSYAADAAAEGNQKYETGPVEAAKNGNLLGWAGYNVLRGLPQLATVIAATAAAPEVEAPALGARAAALGAKAAESTNIGRAVFGITGAAPFAFGQADEATGGDHLRALAMTPALAAMQAWMPGHAEALLANAAGEGGIKGVVKAGLMTGAMQAPLAGAQTALFDAANPNLTTKDRVSNIVDAAIGGAIQGGVIGAGAAGLGSFRAARRVSPDQLSNDALGGMVDEQINPQPQQAPLGLPGPPAQTDAAGRTVVGSDAQDTLNATPRDVGMSPTDRMVADATIPQAQGALPGYTILDQGKEGSLRWAKPYDQAPPSSTGLGPMTDPELEMAHRVLTAKAESGDLNDAQQRHLDLVKQELDYRNANAPLTDAGAQGAVAAVDRTEDGKSGVADTGSAGLAATNTKSWDEQKADLLKGVNGRIRKLYDDAKSPEEMQAVLDANKDSKAQGHSIISDRLEELNASTKAVDTQASGVPKQDDKAALATDKTKAPEPAAPANSGGGDQSVDADFQKKWGADLGSKKGVAIDALKSDNPPANEAEAKQRLYEMLGKSNPAEDAVGDGQSDGHAGVVDLAKKYGILDKDGSYTKEGLEIAKNTPISQSDAVEEAQRRKVTSGDVARPYDGTEVSAFDAGARGIDKTSFDSIHEFDAFQKGHQWAEDRRSGADLHPGATEAQTKEVQGSLRDTRPTEEATRKQFLNQAVDKVYGQSMRPQDQARLKSLIRKGATGDEIDQAAKLLKAGGDETRYFQTGHGALAGASDRSVPFKGETVTRGAPRDPDKLAAIRGETNPTKGDLKAKSEQAIADHDERKQLLRDEIHGSVLSGDITPLDRIRLLNMVNQNKLQDVIDRLPGGSKHGGDVGSGHFLNALASRISGGREFTAPARTEASPNLKLKIMSGDLRGSLREIADNGSTPLNRLIARKLDGAWLKDVTLSREAFDPERTGRTMLNTDGSSHIQVFGNQGMNEETLLHEAIHALVHRRWAGDPGNDPLAARISELHDQIRSAMEKAYPELTNNEIWASEVHRDADEMISWVMTNPDAQEALKQIDINGNKIDTGKSSLWDQFKGLVSDLLGLPTNGRVMSALDHILQAGHAVLDEKEKIYAAEHVPTPIINDRLQAAVGLAAKEFPAKAQHILDTVEPKDKLFRAALQTMHGTHLTEKYGLREKVMPELVDWQHIGLNTNAVRNTFAKIALEASDRFDALSKRDPKASDRINDMALAAASGRNPELPWSKQTWLHNDPQAALLKKYVDEDYRNSQAVRSAGHLPVYNGLKNTLETVGLVHMFQRINVLMRSDPTVAEAAKVIGDPIAQFLKDTDKHTPEAAVEHFRGVLDNAMTALERSFSHIRNDPSLSAKDIERAEGSMTRVESEIKTIRDQLGSTRNVPYFHLYREGDHMVAAKMKTTDDGRVDPAAVRAVSAELAKAGFADLKVAPDLSNPRLFLSLDNKAQRELAQGVMERMAAKGHVELDSIMAGRNAREALLGDASKRNMDYLLQQVESNSLFATEGKTPAEVKVINDQKQAVMDAMREAWLNSLPGNSLSRVMAQRRSVQGFEKDMLKSTINRSMVGISAAARMWARPQMNDVMTRMEQRRKNSLHVTDAQHNKTDTISALVNNIRQRDISQASGDRHDWTDTARTISNVFHLGLSPAMVLVDGSQLGVLVLPHLGARHGFGSALGAMARSTPTALRVIREAFKQGWDVSSLRAAEGNLTHNVLKAAIPDKETRTFIEHLIATGAIDIGSHTRSLIDAGSGASPGLQKSLHYAAAMEQYTEVMSRLITALSARDLHTRGKLNGPVEDYAMRTLNDTLGQYSASNAPPLLTKKGPWGKVGPLALQFKNFEINLMWKLSREFHSAFLDKANTPEEKSVARRFLMGHLLVETAIAGTLGLPFAGVVAGVVDKVKDEFWGDEHPFDANAEVRNYLANMFGKDVGEAISRGVPRSLGFDLSGRVGEEDLMPLTQLMVSRQNWGDTLDEWQAQAVGAPASMVADSLRGLDQIHNGNVLGGAATLMPTAFRNPARAYIMTQKGYVDSNGVPLPMPTPGAGAILAQMIGLTPEQKAEYNDSKNDQIETKQAVTRTQVMLQTKILRALQAGDNETAKEVIKQAVSFDEANPSYAVLPRIEQQLVARKRGQADAAVLHTPIGVNPKDFYGRGLTQYSNVDYQMR